MEWEIDSDVVLNAPVALYIFLIYFCSWMIVSFT